MRLDRNDPSPSATVSGDRPTGARSGRVPQVRIGCSGWQYKHWRGDFYPADLPQSHWFAHYARAFDTVEINNSFYRLPEPQTFAQWRDMAPRGFCFAVKASRYLTHIKKLKDPEEPTQRFFDHAFELRSRLGPVLYQLPPRFAVNVERLAGFLAVLPPGVRHVIEFRDPSWYTGQVFDLLTQSGVALCLHDMEGAATGMLDVGPFVYARFHGATKYAGRYPDDRLDRWAAFLAARVDRGQDVFAYFNNDIGGHAPRDAVRLRARVSARHTASRRAASR